MTDQALATETLAARPPVPAPEANAVEALIPETQIAPETPTLPAAVTAAPTGTILTEAQRAQAEQNLTQYLAPKLTETIAQAGNDAASIKTLFEHTHITFSGDLKQGRTDVKISLSGPNIGANEALVGEALVTALKQHPAFAALFETDKPPHAQPAAGGGHAALEVHIPQLETSAYAALFKAVAAHTVEQPAPATPQAEATPQEVAADAVPLAQVANDNIPENTVSEVTNHEKQSQKAQGIV